MTENVIKEYPEEIVEITEESIRKYIEGISENNPVFLKDGVKAPPLYATALSIPFTGRVLFDDEVNQGINPMRVVHGEQDSRIFRLIKAGDKIGIKTKFLGIEQKETGTLFTVKAEQYDKTKGEKNRRRLSFVLYKGGEKRRRRKEERRREERVWSKAL
jgi:hypothetical protein